MQETLLITTACMGEKYVRSVLAGRGQAPTLIKLLRSKKRHMLENEYQVGERLE